MKSMRSAVVALLLTFALPYNLYAACPNINSGACCGTFWYEYAFTTSCAGTSGSVSNSTLSCYSTPAHSFTGTGTVTYSYTIGASDPIINSNHWSASIFVDFDDPNNSQFNTLNITVGVTHNGVTTSNTLLSWNGQSGDLSCSREDFWYFSAVAGDTISVTISATNFNSGSTTIKTAAPILFNEV